MLAIDINNYIALYNLAKPISKVKLPVEDETFKVFKASNVDVRILDRDKYLRIILDTEKYGSIQNFLKDTPENSHRFFYMVPVQTPSGTIVGFILRTVFDKSYMTISNSFEDRTSYVPFMFGWFKDFVRYNKEEKRLPIVVREGPKDCIALKKIYPYTLSANTDSLGVNVDILKQITNDILLVYDNDEPGKRSMQKDKKILVNPWVNCDTFHVPDGYKDVPALLAKDKDEFKRSGKSLSNRVKKLHLHQM